MDRLYLRDYHRAEIIAKVIEALPEEACGLLGGRAEQVEVVLPVTNRLHSSTRYFMEPLELLKALQQLEADHLEILAIYHSHPAGPGALSASDIEEFNYPGSAALICFPHKDNWAMRVYLVDGKTSREIELRRMPSA